MVKANERIVVPNTSGADPGEVKWVNFHPLFLSPLRSFFSYPSNIEIIFDFSDVITKIHPPFQNSGSALDLVFDFSKKINETRKT